MEASRSVIPPAENAGAAPAAPTTPETPAQQAEQAEALRASAQALADLQQQVESPESFRDVLRQLTEPFNQLFEQIKSIFANIGQPPPVILLPDSPAAQAATARTSTEAVSPVRNLDFTVMSQIPQLIARQGQQVYTSGSPGRLGNGDQQFDLNSPEADAHFNGLITLGIRSVISLSGNRTQIAQKIGRTAELSHITTQGFTIPSVDDVDDANREYRNQSLVNNIGRSLQLYRQGNLLIHCQNGAHRSVALSLILFMLENPNLSYEAALSQNLTRSESVNRYFLAYAPLAKALDNNPELRSRILAASNP